MAREIKCDRCGKVTPIDYANVAVDVDSGDPTSDRPVRALGLCVVTGDGSSADLCLPCAVVVASVLVEAIEAAGAAAK